MKYLKPNFLGLSFLILSVFVAPATAQNRPQTPQPPFPYQAEEVFFDNVTAGALLAGTLTLPLGEGPFPAAVLITGSGAQNRDEEVFGHRPFAVLADFLTRRGIAVLRYDDRGVFGSTGMFEGSTTEDFADDALAGVKYLKDRADIDPGHIGLIGHSEGGLVAPMAAVRSSDVSFIVLLAGPGVVGEEILYAQQALIARDLGASEEDIATGRAINGMIFDIMKEESDNQAAADRIRQAIRLFEGISGAERREAETALVAQFPFLLSDWYRFFLTYDPVPALRQVTVPVLAINGSTDLQVPPDNLQAIAAALQEGGNTDFSTVELPGLNHFFQTSATGSTTEYETIEETFAPAALEQVADWLVARVLPSATAVLDGHVGAVPQAAHLGQNYPNPFNSGTAIGFSLPTSANIRLEVYAMNGQKIATLARGGYGAGTHVLHWDGRDDGGASVASGIYHYRLYSGDGTGQTRKLLLLR
jgi:uncharacterized protein